MEITDRVEGSKSARKRSNQSKYEKYIETLLEKDVDARSGYSGNKSASKRNSPSKMTNQYLNESSANLSRASNYKGSRR